MRDNEVFSRNKSFRFRNGAVQMNAAAVQLQCHDYIRQMALPLVPVRRIKGALSSVSRDTGVSYSKIRKIYYGLTDHILAFEWRGIVAAYQRHVVEQEKRLEAELQTLRALRDARALRENQHELDFAPSARDLGPVDGAAADRGGEEAG